MQGNMFPKTENIKAERTERLKPNKAIGIDPLNSMKGVAAIKNVCSS